MTFCRRVLRLGKSRSWIAASWNTPTPRWSLSNRAILVQQQGYTGSAKGLYWLSNRAILVQQQGYTGSATGLYWLSNRAILVQQQGYTGSATGLYWFRQSAVGWTLPTITKANHIDQVQRNAHSRRCFSYFNVNEATTNECHSFKTFFEKPFLFFSVNEGFMNEHSFKATCTQVCLRCLRKVF